MLFFAFFFLSFHFFHFGIDLLSKKLVIVPLCVNSSLDLKKLFLEAFDFLI